jgi:hypothetical protein
MYDATERMTHMAEESIKLSVRMHPATRPLVDAIKSVFPTRSIQDILHVAITEYAARLGVEPAASEDAEPAREPSPAA